MKIFTIAFYDFKKMFRDRTALFFTLLLPVIFTYVLGVVFGNAGASSSTTRIPVGIVNLDKSDAASRLMAEVSKDNSISLMDLDEEKLFDEVESGAVEIGFIIPEGFQTANESGSSPEIKVVKLASSSNFRFFEGIFAAAFAKIRTKEETISYLEKQLNASENANMEAVLNTLDEKLDEKLDQPGVVGVKEIKYADDIKSNDYNGEAQVSIGFMVMFVMFSVVFGAGEILEEKKINTWGRLSITPASRPAIMAGKVLGTFIKGWFQVAFLIFFGQFVMGINWGNSIAATIFIVNAYLLAATGLGMLLSSIVKTNSQLGAFGSIIIMCSSMMSGCWWPIDLQPVFMQQLAAAFPQYWAMKGLLNTVAGNLGLESVVAPSLALLAMAIIFFVLSILTGSFKGRRKNGRLFNAKINTIE